MDRLGAADGAHVVVVVFKFEMLLIFGHFDERRTSHRASRHMHSCLQQIRYSVRRHRHHARLYDMLSLFSFAFQQRGESLHRRNKTVLVADEISLERLKAIAWQAAHLGNQRIWCGVAQSYDVNRARSAGPNNSLL